MGNTVLENSISMESEEEDNRIAADLDSVHQTKLAVLCLVHDSGEKLPFVEQQLILPTEPAKVVWRSLA